jgi:hypothetical protein
MNSTISKKELNLSCPLCKNNHVYTLIVTESPVIYQPTVLHYDWSPNFEEFTRTFLCPDKKEMFQTSFRIEVKGIVKKLEIAV